MNNKKSDYSIEMMRLGFLTQEEREEYEKNKIEYNKALGCTLICFAIAARDSCLAKPASIAIRSAKPM